MVPAVQPLPIEKGCFYFKSCRKKEMGPVTRKGGRVFIGGGRRTLDPLYLTRRPLSNSSSALCLACMRMILCPPCLYCTGGIGHCLVSILNIYMLLTHEPVYYILNYLLLFYNRYVICNVSIKTLRIADYILHIKHYTSHV